MRYRNPTNGHIESKSYPALWVLLFGPFYFLFSGIWVHAVVMFAVVVGLFAAMGPPGIVPLVAVYIVHTFFADKIVEGYYLRKGWEKFVGSDTAVAASPVAVPDTKECPFCAETIKAAAVVCRYCGRDLPAEAAA